MKYSYLPMLIFLGMASGVCAAADAIKASNGMQYPYGWQDWPVIAVSHRTDNNTMRVILGNPLAIKAARSGNMRPWPDGSVLAKVVWKQGELSSWPSAIVAGKLVHAEFMFKNAKRSHKNDGWKWARWLGVQQQPFNKGDQSCADCHAAVKHRDWVFSEPAALPSLKLGTAQ